MAQGGALPPTDHVARVLLSRGARDQAIALLQATIARDPGERACAALLRAVEARPDASVYVPDLAIDLKLVREYARRGMLREAIAILRGTELGERDGLDELKRLEELFAIVPRDDEASGRLDRGDATGALAILRQRTVGAPWLARAVAILQATATDGGAMGAGSQAAQSEFEAKVGVLIDQRDLRAAAAAARELSVASPSDMPLRVATAALERLVSAIDAIEVDPEADFRSTQPMSGYPLAALQLRMGNLERGERVLRQVLEQDPNHRAARERLSDLETLRAARAAACGVALPEKDDGAFESARAAFEEDDTIGESVSDVPPPSTGQPFTNTAPERPSMRRTIEDPPRGIDPLAKTNDVRSSADPLASTNEIPRDVDPLSRTAEARRADGISEDSIANAPTGIAPPGLGQGTAKEGSSPGTSVKEGSSPGRTSPKGESGLHKGLLSNPELLAKKAAPSGDYAPSAKKVNSFDIEPRTEELRQDVEAELLLKQGYAQRALELYQRLADRHPNVRSYAIRAAEIDDLIRRDRVPVPAEITVRRHIPEVSVAGRDLEAQTIDRRYERDSEPPTLARGAQVEPDSSSIRSREAPSAERETPSSDGVRVSQIIVVRNNR